MKREKGSKFFEEESGFPKCISMDKKKVPCDNNTNGKEPGARY